MSQQDVPPGNQEALQRLYRISASDGMDFEAKVRAMLELGCSYLGLEIGFVSHIDEERNYFEVTEARGDHELIQAGSTSPLTETYCRRAIASDGLLGVQNAPAEDWEEDPAYEKFDLGCYLGGKLTVEGELYGTLCFADDVAREATFSEAERTFVELMTEWLSYELNQRERKRELRAERQFIQDVIDSLEDVLFVLDPDATLVRWNDQLGTVTGYDDAEIEGAPPVEFIAEEDREAVTRAIAEVFETGNATVQARLRARDGSRPTYEFRGRKLTDAEGELLGICGVGRDVSDREARERELAQYEMIVETMRDAAWIAGTDGRLQFVNDRVTELLEVPENEIVGRSFADLLADDEVAGDALAEYADGLNAVLAGEEPEFRIEMSLSFGWERGVLDVRVVPLRIDDDIAGAVAVARDITRQKRREERLAQYEQAMASVEGMVYVLDDNGRFSIVTPGFAERLGYDRDALLGKDVSFVLDEETLSARQERIERLGEGADVTTYAGTAHTASGGEFPIRVEVSALPGGAGTVGAVTDLTELAETRQELEDERDRFEYLFENIPDPVIEVAFMDGEPRIQSTNGAFGEVFGYGEAEIREASTNEVLVPDSAREEARDLDERAIGGEVTSAEISRETADGRRDFLFRGVPYPREEDTYAFGIYTDITDQKRRERYLTVLSRVLRHNLRNDLNLVIGYADEIARQVRDPELRSEARTIEETARDLLEVSEEARDIEDVLDLGSIDRRTVDAADMLESVVAEYRDADPAASIETDLPASLPVAASDRLRTVFEELVENAIEHHPGEPHVRIGAERTDEWVTIRIADDGPGISDIEHEIVAGDREITPLEHGSGLGLWLATWIVEAYGGHLDVTVDGGTTIRIRLRHGDSPG
jgi:PAS domain S-box-containing protein